MIFSSCSVLRDLKVCCYHTLYFGKVIAYMKFLDPPLKSCLYMLSRFDELKRRLRRTLRLFFSFLFGKDTGR